MHDFGRILRAASQLGTAPLALATIVRTRGSTYRRPGARMLIERNGEPVGALSGGCLEEEIADCGRAVIESGVPRVLRFDTRRFFGCDGQIDVLVETIPAYPPERDLLGILGRRLTARQPTLITTIFATEPGAPQLGSIWGADALDQLPWQAREDALAAIAEGQSRSGSYAWGECLFDLVQPPVRLVIIGSGHDVAPLENLSASLGWSTLTVSHPAARMPDDRGLSESAIVASPEELAAQIKPDPLTAVVVMTHHFGRDLAYLDAVLPLDLPYIGLLGPRKRREQILVQLADSRDSFDPGWLQKLRSPVGLDLGAESPEEIALSIAAEVRAALANRSAKPLRECKGPIHGTISRAEEWVPHR